MKIVKKPLSKVEERIWEYILAYFEDYPYAPTRKEITEAMGFRYISQADNAVRNMQRKGWIRLDGHKWRNIIDPKDYEQRNKI